MRMLTDLSLGIAGSLLIAGVATGCGAATNPSIVKCKLEALDKLPRDPMHVTPYDGTELVKSIRACEQAGSAPGDAGTP